MTYNSDGTLATVTAPNPATGLASGGLVTSYTYDSDARVTRITNPDGTHQDFTYDSENHLLTSTDELGRVTRASAHFRVSWQDKRGQVHLIA